MFNPMRAFKKEHHDKIIDGENRFAPFPCKAFCYSKQFLHAYFFAVRKPIEYSILSERPKIPSEPVIFKVELRRVPGPPCEDGYYTYVLEPSNDPAK